MCASNQSICLEKNRLGWLKFLEESLPLSLRRRSRTVFEDVAANGETLAQSPLRLTFLRNFSRSSRLNGIPRTSEAATEKSWGFWQPRWVWDSSLLLFVRNSLYQFRKSGRNWRDFWKVSTKNANVVFQSVNSNLRNLMAKSCKNQTDLGLCAISLMRKKIQINLWALNFF